VTFRAWAVATALAAAVAVGLAQSPQGTQSDGALNRRPGADRQPEFPAPTIREYKPHSTLVVPQHPVPRAKYPVIDIHSHQPAPIGGQQLATVVQSMDPLNLRVLVNASGATGDRLVQSVAAIRNSPYKDRMVMFTNIAFQEPVGPGFGQRVAKQIEDDVKNGALGIGEIMKNFGLRARKLDGSRLTLDDPELDPIWDAAARLNVPVLIHTADPQEFFQPINAERDRLFKKHPKTTFIMAHLGWHANDLGRLAKMFDEMPNVYGEVGAILYDLGRQPRAAHDFMVKYQDRILFGKDSYQPDEYPYYWRVFETADEYFDYYRDYHAFWKLYGLALPDAVLRKLYYANALKLVPGIPKTAFPS